MSLAELNEGTIIAVDSDMSLTELEKQAKNGNIDINKYKNVTGLPTQYLTAPADQGLQSKIDEISRINPNIAAPIDISQLSAEKRSQVYDFLRSVATEPAKTDLTLNLPKLDFGTTTKPEVVKEPEVKKPQEPPQSEAPPVIICPNCKWDHSIDPVDATPIDKLNYLRAILGNKPFIKSYTLFGGKIEVTFRTRPLAVQHLINDQLMLENKDGRIPAYPATLSLATHNLRLRRLNLAAALVSITGIVSNLPELHTPEALVFFGSKIEKDKHNVISAADLVLFGNWTETLYSTVFKQYAQFEDLCFRLTEAAASPDFWAGTAEQI